MEPIVDRGRLAFTGNYFGVDLGLVPFNRLMYEEDFLIFVTANLINVRITKKFGERRNKLILPAGSKTWPCPRQKARARPKVKRFIVLVIAPP